MNKYNEGKIYKITANNNKLIYYGSTTKSLWQRFNEHKLCSKRELVSSHLLFNYDDVSMTLVQNVNCSSKKELEDIEKTYINNNICVNKRSKINYESRSKSNILSTRQYIYRQYKNIADIINADISLLNNKQLIYKINMLFFKNYYDSPLLLKNSLYKNILHKINILKKLLHILDISNLDNINKDLTKKFTNHINDIWLDNNLNNIKKTFRKRTNKYDSKQYYCVYLLTITIIKNLFGSDIIDKKRIEKNKKQFFYYIFVNSSN